VGDSVDLKLPIARVTVNNLGGTGPDRNVAEEMRYSGVGLFNGRSLDFVVRVKPGQTYIKNTVRQNNGMVCENRDPGDAVHLMCPTGGWYAQINLAAGARRAKGKLVGERVEFEFSVEYTDNKKPALLPGFVVTFFDIDQNKGNGPNSKVREYIEVSGWKKAVYDKTNSEAEFTVVGNTLKAKSMKFGIGCDNPDDPIALRVIKNCDKKKPNTADQSKRAMMLTYENTQKFDVVYETSCANCGFKQGGKTLPDGRNFLFGFKSALINQC